MYMSHYEAKLHVILFRCRRGIKWNKQPLDLHLRSCSTLHLSISLDKDMYRENSLTVCPLVLPSIPV